MRHLNRYQQSKLDAAFLRSYREDARIRQASKCFYCGEKITAKTVTADHVQARATWGLDHRNNIVAACGRCNVAKGKLPLKEFQQAISNPKPSDAIRFWLAWSRKRINARLDLMAKRLGVEA